jgi:carboxymethylenebutenolidase
MSEENISPAQETMLETFQQHMAAELTGDIEVTMATMTDNPYVNNVPVMTGGVGREGVRRFYSDHLVGKFFPPDAELINASRTVGEDQLVEEIVVNFTHTEAVDWMLPGVRPTGKRVEIAGVVIVKFEEGKVAREHVYWDQASVLVQLGLLDPTGLPVSGAASARKVLDPNLPSRDI